MKRFAALLVALLLLAGEAFLPVLMPDEAQFSAAQAEGQLIAKSKKKKTTPTPAPRATKTPAPTAAATPTPAAPTETPQGPIIEPQAIADYLFANGCLPDNFITKKEAQALGWDNTRNYVSDAAPGKSIGGDRFGNYQELLPIQKGRQYYECDCYYVKGKRNAYRVIFSSDGHVYYTADHYETFTELFPSPGITPVKVMSPKANGTRAP